ncbi:MAG: IS110 family transposase [Anaerolineales bacterium]
MNSPPKSIPIVRYIGIDIHKHYVMVGGQNRSREWVLRPRRVQIRRFRDWAKKNFWPTDAVVIEATGSVWDIYDIVAPHVGNVLVADARSMRQIAEAKVKTDKKDVERMITQLLGNIVPEVWVPPVPVRELRSLISFRWRLNKQITMSKNRLQSVVQRYNLHPPEGGLLNDHNLDWWEKQEFSDLTGFEVQHDLKIVEVLEQQKEALDQKLAELSNTEPWASDMVYLMQIPGMGLILSMTVLSAIGDISRFSHAKKLVGYAGLSPGVHDSGETNRSKPITKEGRKEQRWAMVQAAQAAARSDPYWAAQLKRLEKRMHRNQVFVAIARRLLVTIWHILTKREPYRHFDEETVAYKMLIWGWAMDEKARKGMTRQQFAKYSLLRLGIGHDLEWITKHGATRRLAPTEEILATKPELRPPG